MDPSPVVAPPYAARPLRLEPFRALRLNPSNVGDPASARAFARPYRAVAQRLLDWETSGRLTHDAVPALYLYEYTSAGLTVRGLVGALDVSRRAVDPEERAIWPHEGIHPAQVEELADRMLEMNINPAPILLAYEGSELVRSLLIEVAERTPTADFLDRGGHRQRLWSITDPGELGRIRHGLSTGAALIADGHHRYAAYLRLQGLNPGTAWDRGLAMLVDQVDTPLFLGAIHRSYRGVRLESLLQQARAGGAHTELAEREEAVSRLGPQAVVVSDGTGWATVSPPPLTRRTVVQWFEEDVVAALTPPPETTTFHHHVTDALHRAGPRSAAALLPAPDFATVLDVVSHGGLLPEKATSFQPKPSLGVLMRSLRDEVDVTG